MLLRYFSLSASQAEQLEKDRHKNPQIAGNQDCLSSKVIIKKWRSFFGNLNFLTICSLMWFSIFLQKYLYSFLSPASNFLIFVIHVAIILNDILPESSILFNQGKAERRVAYFLLFYPFFFKIKYPRQFIDCIILMLRKSRLKKSTRSFDQCLLNLANWYQRSMILERITSFQLYIRQRRSSYLIAFRAQGTTSSALLPKLHDWNKIVTDQNSMVMLQPQEGMRKEQILAQINFLVCWRKLMKNLWVFLKRTSIFQRSISFSWESYQNSFITYSLKAAAYSSVKYLDFSVSMFNVSILLEFFSLKIVANFTGSSSNSFTNSSLGSLNLLLIFINFLAKETFNLSVFSMKACVIFSTRDTVCSFSKGQMVLRMQKRAGLVSSSTSSCKEIRASLTIFSGRTLQKSGISSKTWDA